MTYRLLVWAQTAVIATQAMVTRIQACLVTLETIIIKRQTKLLQSGKAPR